MTTPAMPGDDVYLGSILARLHLWMPVPGHPGYEVSDQGEVRSLGRWVNVRHGRRWIEGQVLKGEARNKYGHRRVTLQDNGRITRRAVHQLVLEAFVGPRPEGLWGLHRDGDPSNNVLGNLYYGTPSNNQYDRVRHGNNHNANKTHCPQGHLYDGFYAGGAPSRRTGSRYCKTCRRVSQQTLKGSAA